MRAIIDRGLENECCAFAWESVVPDQKISGDIERIQMDGDEERTDRSPYMR